MSLRSWWQRIIKPSEPSEEEVQQINQGLDSIRDDVAPLDPPPEEPKEP
jgi:hypothetical protein